VDKMLQDAGSDVRYIETSTLMDANIGELKTLACELLLQQRLGEKEAKALPEDIRSRIYCAMPVPRDNMQRPAYLPNSVRAEMALPQPPAPLKTEKDFENEEGGPGVYFPKLSKHYLLDDDSWKDDIVPEIMDGMNILDYVDPDIEQRLVEMEMEEEGRVRDLEAQEQQREKPFQLDSRAKLAVEVIKNKVGIRKMEHALEKSRCHSAPKSRQMEEALKKQQKNIGGVDPSMKTKRNRSQSAEVALDAERALSSHVSTGRSRALTRSSRANDRSLSVQRGEGYKDVKQKVRAVALSQQSARRSWSKEGRKGEADRTVPDLKPKHLLQGKMSMGTRRSR